MIKTKSKKEMQFILKEGQKRLNDMIFAIKFYKNIYNKTYDSRYLDKINILQQDAIELEKEIKIFLEGGE